LTYTWKQNKEGPRDLLKLSFNLLEAQEREKRKEKKRGDIRNPELEIVTAI
jgi:hypothetical protein